MVSFTGVERGVSVLLPNGRMFLSSFKKNDTYLRIYQNQLKPTPVSVSLSLKRHMKVLLSFLCLVCSSSFHLLSSTTSSPLFRIMRLAADDGKSVDSSSPSGSFFNKPSPSSSASDTEKTEKAKELALRIKAMDERSGGSGSGLGFGVVEPPRQRNKAKPDKKYVSIGDNLQAKAQQIARSNNDITNLQTDSDGYTLYKDADGDEKRVLEALVSYPCVFKVKIVGKQYDSFGDDMRDLVQGVVGEEVAVSHSTKVNGKWCSVTVEITKVESAEMLYNIYEVIDLDERVKFKF